MNTQAVQQLRLVCRHRLCQRMHRLVIRVSTVTLPRDLHDRHALQRRRHFL